MTDARRIVEAVGRALFNADSRCLEYLYQEDYRAVALAVVREEIAILTERMQQQGEAGQDYNDWATCQQLQAWCRLLEELEAVRDKAAM